MSLPRVPMAEQFVDHYIPHIDHDFHKAFVDRGGQQVAYDDKAVANTEQLFGEAMQQYQTLIGPHQSEDARQIANCNGWKDLAKLIHKTEDTYINETTLSRRSIRFIGDYESGLQVWAGLLPTDTNLSIMAGGVKLMLGAAGRRTAQRERMLAALRGLFDTVANSEESLRQFHNDQQLRKTAVSLYVSMLGMIEACINSLIHEKMGTKLKYAIFGERNSTIRKKPQNTVDQICKTCNEKQREFDRQVQALTVATITETASATKRVEEHMTDRVESHVAHTDTVTTETLHTAKEIQERGRRMDVQMRRVSDVVDVHGDLLLNIRQLLRDMLANNEWQREVEERKSQTTRLQIENYQLGVERVRSLTPSEAPTPSQKKWLLWNIINVEPERCVEDAESMLRNGQNLSRAPGQVRGMYRNKRVKEFLTSASPDAILVEAPMEGHEMSRCSPMSLACAMLLQDLSGHSHAAAIHYFCGLHNKEQDPVSGSVGIARILIAQLLWLQEFDFAFLTSEWRVALEQGNPQALYKLFEPLIGQLKTATLFCVIDSIALFEGNRWRDNTIALISELLRVAVDCNLQVHFKLLITSSSRSRFVAPLFPQYGLNGVVRLRPDDEDTEVSMRAVRLEIARNHVGKSPSPAGGHRL